MWSYDSVSGFFRQRKSPLVAYQWCVWEKDYPFNAPLIIYNAWSYLQMNCSITHGSCWETKETVVFFCNMWNTGFCDNQRTEMFWVIAIQLSWGCLQFFFMNIFREGVLVDFCALRFSLNPSGFHIHPNAKSALSARLRLNPMLGVSYRMLRLPGGPWQC